MTRASGYTLLEMVVVLALMGLAVGMAAPAGFRMIESWREAGDVDEVLRQLAALPTAAREQGRAVRLPPDDGASMPAVLPEGWSLEMDEALVVRPNGACGNAQGRLLTRRQAIDFRVEAPFCRIIRTPPQ